MKTNLFLNLSLSLILLNCSTATFGQTIRLKAVGDIMMGSHTPTEVLPPRKGYEYVDSTASLLDSSDITFGNLEGVFIKQDIAPKKCSEASRKAKRCYEFGMPSYLAPRLKDLHFSLLSMDNNHNSDYGYAGVKHSQMLLDSIGIRYAAKKKPILYQIDSTIIGVIAFGHSSASYQVFDLKTTKNIISQYDTLCDILIVSFHGGAEGFSAQHVKDTTEKFYGENRGNLIQFSHTAIDAGADIIIGHGPHVLRAIDIYKGKLICYSLGNFLTYGNVSLKGVKGQGAIMDIELDQHTGNFMNGQIIPTQQVSRGIPIYDKKQKAIQTIRQLSSEDFPTSELEITPTGQIQLK